MQFSVIRTYAATRFRDASLAIVTDADWKLYVNSAYDDANTQIPFAPWAELSTTVTIAAGTRTGALPTDANKVTAVWNSTDQYKMQPIQGRSDVFEQYPGQDEVGNPLHYRLLGNTLYIYPLGAQSTSFTVEYVKHPAAMVNDSDEPAFPEAFHDILVPGAVALAYRDDGNMQLAEQYEKEFKDGLFKLVQDSMQPRQDRFYEIVDDAF